jgi:hypothetical protein
MTKRQRVAVVACGVMLAISACRRAPGIRVVQASYGANCGAPAGNLTVGLIYACDGKGDCWYRIDHTVIGDPAPGCSKSFQAAWRCGGEDIRRLELPGEAGFGSVAVLTCRTS